MLLGRFLSSAKWMAYFVSQRGPCLYPTGRAIEVVMMCRMVLVGYGVIV